MWCEYKVEFEVVDRSRGCLLACLLVCLYVEAWLEDRGWGMVRSIFEVISLRMHIERERKTWEGMG